MKELSIYVGSGYMLYYMVAIGFELLKSPKKEKKSEAEFVTVTGADVEENFTEVEDDIDLSPVASSALKKKGN